MMALKKNQLRNQKIAVIGAGWAGAAAVFELIEAGHTVHWLEASRQLGGRARAVEINGKTLDNGQHILLGAYKETLALFKRLALDLDQVLLRLPLQMVYPHKTGMQFIAPRLPAPLHLALALLRAQGLEREDKLALARFSTTARWMDWQLNVDCTVAELLDRYQQTPRLIALMWRPLCIAALNTLPEQASAKVFLAILRDSLGAKRTASDMLLPKTDLSQLLPNAVAKKLEQHGGKVFLGARVDQLAYQDSFWYISGQLSDEVATQAYDAIILATPTETSRDLLTRLNANPELEVPRVDTANSAITTEIPEFQYEAITTCYLQYEDHLRLARPFFALVDQVEQRRFAQFVFDRGQLKTEHAGLLAVVISAPQEAKNLDRSAIAQLVANQLAEDLQMPSLARPLWAQVITEKRATFRCVPNLNRPTNQTRFQGLLLAGDYTQSDYPATLETAVRSGLSAARALSS